MVDKQLKIIEEDIVDEDGELVKVEEPQGLVPEPMNMSKMMELSEMLAKSTIVPVEYQNRMENIFIALDMANRIGISPMAVMSNMYIVNGKASFSGSFISALIKSSPLFSNAEVVWVGEKGKDNWGCYIKAIDNRLEKEVKGPTVDIRMVKMEKWDKNPKWKSMTELMLQYRAWSFFGRTHASELLNGVYDSEEMEDIGLKGGSRDNPYDK